ncbi:NlpC/P60 family protein [Sedimentitalea todarodis]|uniref:NlpC/P60 family protein n=1 Tax=Sedimentitalea todarodis TaxID=1631240 RepID=A0ABU3VCI9_9RHOB|nr:NlpC/P60 family protein [Sedimentitalea todarodis]MDU9003886.1 NlpC/P60 family protein [Sedimentitalea todarodis]
MTSGQETIVEIARSWLGTPYRHQAACRGAGTDCLGLVRGVWRDVMGSEPEVAPAYSMDWSEPQGQERLWQAASSHLSEQPHVTDGLSAGDVILFRMRTGAVAKHLGIVSVVGASPAFIHAYEKYGVVESPLSQPWQQRIVARFKFPLEVF